MATLTITKTPTGYESEVITDKINAIQVVFEENTLHKIDIAISVDGENFISNATYKVADKGFCQIIADDVEGLSKKIILNDKPVSVSIL